MLQSEFYDRTKVTLTGEEYGEVENIYNRVQMNKDEFCKLWLNNRDNQIIKELVQTCMALERQNAYLAKTNDILDAENANLKTSNYEYESIVEKFKNFREKTLNFARYLILNIGDDSRIYDAIKETFHLDFIVRTKLEAKTEINNLERDYLLSML